MSTGSSQNPVAKPPGTAHRVRVIIFRVVATFAGLFFVVAVVLMASAPWVLLQPDQDVRTELNRWFLTVAGSVDAITCVCAAANTAIGPREWPGPTRPVLDLNSQSPSEYFSRPAKRGTRSRGWVDHRPQADDDDLKATGVTCPTGLIEVGFDGS